MTRLRPATLRRLGAATAVAVAAATATTVALPAAQAGHLPGGRISKKLVDGTKVKARLYDEYVRYHPGNVANIQTSREVWLSGKIVAEIAGEAQGATIYGGYVVGCQVSVTGASNGNNTGNDGYGNYAQTIGTTLHLGPGQAGWVPIIQRTQGTNPSDTTYNVNRFTFRGNRGGVAFSDESFRLNGCGGFAQARARFTVEVETATVRSQIVLWGKPFTLG